MKILFYKKIWCFGIILLLLSIGGIHCMKLKKAIEDFKTACNEKQISEYEVNSTILLVSKKLGDKKLHIQPARKGFSYNEISDVILQVLRGYRCKEISYLSKTFYAEAKKVSQKKCLTTLEKKRAKYVIFKVLTFYIRNEQ